MCRDCQDAEAQYGVGSESAQAVQRFLHATVAPQRIDDDALTALIAILRDDHFLGARHDDD